MQKRLISVDGATVNGVDRQVQPIDMTTTLDAAGEDGLMPGVFLVAWKLNLKTGDKLALTISVNDTLNGGDLNLRNI